MRARTRWLTAVTLAATMVGGCGARPASGPATSADTGAMVGGKPGPIAITVADSQSNGKPSNLPLAEFKRQVETAVRRVDDRDDPHGREPTLMPPGSDGASSTRSRAGPSRWPSYPPGPGPPPG